MILFVSTFFHRNGDIVYVVSEPII